MTPKAQAGVQVRKLLHLRQIRDGASEAVGMQAPAHSACLSHEEVRTPGASTVHTHSARAWRTSL